MKGAPVSTSNHINTPDQHQDARFIDHNELRAFVTGLFAHHGLPDKDAATCANALVMADLRGVWSHGVVRMPMYCGRLRAGVANASPAITVNKVAAATAHIDGDDGLGLVVAPRAMDEAIALAHEAGIGMAGVKRSGHFGMAALYAAQAAEAGCLGLVFTNASPALPPFGAARKFFGTSPFSFAAPAGKSKPAFLIDMAMSMVARGKLKFSAQRGEPIPEGYALDAEGRPTTDGKAAFEGVVLPFAAHKGAALSWMQDILGGVFTGAAFGGEARNPFTGLDGPQGTGHLFIAIKADAFQPLATFEERMATLDDRAKALPRADGFAEILAPGEPESRATTRHEDKGVPLTPDILDALRDEGDAAGVEWPFG